MSDQAACRRAAGPPTSSGVTTQRLLAAASTLAAGLAAPTLIPVQAAEAPAGDWVFGPAEPLHPVYVADPHRPRMHAGIMAVADSDLEDRFDVGKVRIALDAGARVPIVRYGGRGADLVGAWQLTIDAGIFSQFDAEHSLDNVGWDGWLAGHVTTKVTPDLTIKGAFRHLSAHRGDEFILRTGTERLDYTREDLSLAAAYATPWRVTVYAEVGYATTLSADDDFQKPWLIQTGIQERIEPDGDDVGYEWGVEARWYEEDDWDTTVIGRGALLIPMASGRWMAVELEARDGRSALGEFAFADERSLTAGIAFEF